MDLSEVFLLSNFSQLHFPAFHLLTSFSQVDDITSNALLSSLEKSSKWLRAMQTLQRLESHDVVAYNATMSACVNWPEKTKKPGIKAGFSGWNLFFWGFFGGFVWWSFCPCFLFGLSCLGMVLRALYMLFLALLAEFCLCPAWIVFVDVLSSISFAFHDHLMAQCLDISVGLWPPLSRSKEKAGEWQAAISLLAQMLHRRVQVKWLGKHQGFVEVVMVFQWFPMVSSWFPVRVGSLIEMR